MTRPAEAHTLVAASVLNALEPAEAALVDAHLAECESCAAEVAEFRAVTDILASDAEQAPPPPLRAAVLGEITRTRQLAPLPRHPDDAPSRSRSARPRRRAQPAAGRRWVKGRGPLVGVAAVLTALCLGLGFVVTDQQGKLDADQTQIEALSELVSAAVDGPSATQFPGGGRMAVVRAGEQALLVTRDLPELPHDRTYQLWVMDTKASVRSAGLIGNAGNRGDERFLQVAGLASDDTDLAVTVEPAGGSKQPTTPVLATVKLNAAKRN